MVKTSGAARYLVGVVLGGGVIASIACGLVIDPDELVADNGGAFGSDASLTEDASVIVTADAADASIRADAADGGPQFEVGCRNSPAGSIAACSPAPPAGSELFAVIWGRVGTGLPCPSGYVSSSELRGYADIEKASPPCSSTGCACGQSGTGGCVGRVQYYSDNACSVPSTSDTLAASACTRTDRDSSGSASLRFSVTGVTCAPSGTSATTFEPATLCTEMHACRPDPNASLPACGAGQVPTPTAAKARLCYRAAGACTAPYVSVPGFSTTSTINDTRACTCSCDLANGGCTGGTADRWNDSNGCSGTVSETLGPGCRVRTQFHRSVKLVTNATPQAGALCSASAKVTGALTLPSVDVSLCCVPE